MSSTKTNKNLIEIIFSTLMERLTEKKIETKIVITSKDIFSEETQMEVQIKWRDLKTLFDKADYITTHQVDFAAKEDCALIEVICSDSNVFVLLCRMYVVANWFNADVRREQFGKYLESRREV